MDYARPTATPDDDTVELAPALSRCHAWHRLHVSTWGIVGATLVVLTLVVVPGRVNDHGVFTGALLFEEHGWPLVFLERSLTSPRSQGSSPEKKFLNELRAEARLRTARFPEYWSEYGSDVSRGEPLWLDATNRPFRGEYVVYGWGLAIDLATTFGILGAVSVAFEWWRRRRFRYSLRCLFGVVLLFAVALAWSFSHIQPESRAAAALHNNGFEVDMRCDAPVWLKGLVGANHLPSFYHVVAVRTAEMGELTPEEAERRMRAVGIIAEHIAHLRYLQHLFLNNEAVTDSDLKCIEGLAELEVLYLDDTRVTDAGLAHIHDLPRLRFVDLDNTKITGAGFRHFRRLPRLQDLSLDGTQVTDAALPYLKALPQLQTLSLTGTKVTDSGLQHLKGLTGLKTVLLGGTRVTDAGLRHFEAAVQLERLEVNDTKVTVEGVRRLQQALPDCEVFCGFYVPDCEQ